MSLTESATAQKHEEALRGLRGRIESLRASLDAALQAKDEADRRLDVALAIQEDDAKRVIRKIRPKRKTSESVAVALASDWHSEERVRPETVNGRNEFNLKIAQKRIQRFFENLVYLIKLQRNGTKIDTLVLAMLGDFMTGYIHEELVEGNELSPVETILWLFREISAGIEYLESEAELDRIILPCTVGNHGRTTMKMRVSTSCQNSYEWMMYHFLAQRFPQHEWQIADGYHTYLDIYGRNVRCHHGDAIKYQGGIGGISIPVNKAIGAWDRNIAADLDIFGHWHQRLASRKWICNGSLIGWNAYSIKIKAEYEPPSQTFFLMEKDHGQTIISPIFLT